MFSTACLAAYFFSTYFVPETANVSLEEIDAVFRSAAGREDLAVRKRVSSHALLLSQYTCEMLMRPWLVQIERELGLDALVRELSRGEVE